MEWSRLTWPWRRRNGERCHACQAAPVQRIVKADVGTAEGVRTVVRAVVETLGGVDILVNNVGGSSAPAMISSIKSARSETPVVVGVVIRKTPIAERHASTPRS